MEILTKFLMDKIEELSKVRPDIKLTAEDLDGLRSAYPFNEVEYIISHLISAKIISLQEYLNLRNEYLNRNKYLYVFEMTAPRTFGETWAQRHLNEIVPELMRPAASLDESYSGEYDFWYDGIKIEVKASRAVRRQSGESLIEKALSIHSQSGFDMNFQQIKPSCCDVFVWIGVWKDAIRYWVLSSNEVENNKYYSAGQHRGNMGEGQLRIRDSNINEFIQYEVNVREILDKIIEKAKLKSE